MSNTKMKTHYSCTIQLSEDVTFGGFHSYEDGYKYNGMPTYRLDINVDGNAITKYISEDAIDNLYYTLQDIRSAIGTMPRPGDA